MMIRNKPTDLRSKFNTLRDSVKIKIFISKNRTKIHSINHSFVFFLAFVFLLSACSDSEKNNNKQSTKDTPLFSILEPSKSGIQFRNDITESKEKNYFNYEYIYNGAGVAVGDFDNDELVDIFFVGNENSNALYHNKGQLNFEDISVTSGVQGEAGWSTGATVIDINEDGLLDIYVCRSGWPSLDKNNRRNQLFINKGNLEFEDQASAFGLAESGFSIQSSFFDYDNDGDLDVYITNHPIAFNLSLEERLEIRNNPPDENRDKLYRNEGSGKFKEVSLAAGIKNYGHGLGIMTADINQDGWIDIYIANDYKEPDYYYVNQGNGTFKNEIDKHFGHIAFNAMGVDVADINNDGFEDILTTEMLPSDYKRSKTNMASMNVTLFESMKQLGLHSQYMHNMLQLNTGMGRFNDISQLAGVSKTDWSWSCLMSDFDNDGHRDIFVANGNKRDVFDKDYKIKADQQAKASGGSLSLEDLYQIIPSTTIPNEIFRNKGNLQFENKTFEWGIEKPMLSQGAAEADFDNDGDLDLVVNNLDDLAYIYENNADQNKHNFLRVKLDGGAKNRTGLNAKISIVMSEGKQYFEMKGVRGYESCSEMVAHFGLGKTQSVSQLLVEWPNGKQTTVSNPKINQTLTVSINDASPNTSQKSKPEFVFQTKAQLNKTFNHKENKHDDYRIQVLLPHKLSQNGPFVTTGDLNNDQLEDFFVGGAHQQSGAIYIQQQNGDFKQIMQPALEADRACEDLGSCFFDADQDGDQDIFVVSGGSEFPVKSKLYQDRLYLNDGKGNFTLAQGNLPPMISSCQSVSVCDYDQDGDEDLFVGGRVFPDHYPYATPSYLLQNNNGKFTDLALSQQQGLNMAGMVTSSCWADIDSDQDKDLIIVGEWMPITIFENNQGVFVNATQKYDLQNTTGWWNKITPLDYDGDGDQDFVIGNLGLNHKFSAKTEKPFHVYCGDYDANGSYDIVLAKEHEDKQVPIRGRQCASEQMPFIAENFATYEAFADASIVNLIGEQVNEKLHYQAKIFESIILENTGQGFEIKPLPIEAQVSPINGIVVDDINSDQIPDLILGGNMFHTEAETSKADASHGLVLLGQSNKTYKVLAGHESGLFIPGDVKDIQSIKTQKGKHILVGNNDSQLQILSY